MELSVCCGGGKTKESSSCLPPRRRKSNNLGLWAHVAAHIWDRVGGWEGLVFFLILRAKPLNSHLSNPPQDTALGPSHLSERGHVCIALLNVLFPPVHSSFYYFIKYWFSMNLYIKECSSLVFTRSEIGMS